MESGKMIDQEKGNKFNDTTDEKVQEKDIKEDANQINSQKIE